VDWLSIVESIVNLSPRYEKTKHTKTGLPNKLVLKQQTEGAAIKTERAVLGAGGYV
jgi:hypothetical protein